jgi:dUTP pyrophosphatase
MSDNNFEVIEGGKTEENIQLPNSAGEAVRQQLDEELAQIYEENEELVNLLGGMEIIETLLEISDEEFVVLAPTFLQVFDDVLQESKTRSEIAMMLTSGKWTIEEIEREITMGYGLIDEMDALSVPKKDFLKKILIEMSNTIKQINGMMLIDIPYEAEDDVKVPVYARKGDAGMDIYAREEITINPGETKIIDTGIKMAIPEGYAILIQPRSGQSVKTKLRIANTPGLIDSGYRDSIGVIVENIEPPFKDIDYEFDDNGEIHIKSILHGSSYTIAEGQKFAQMRLVKVPTANLIKVDSVADIGEDRGGGFGHTDNSEQN